MKVEKVDENKVKFILSYEELKMRNITINDIEKNNSVAKNLYASLIEESNLDEEFDDSHIFIEACSKNNNTVILTITKVENLPDINTYNKNRRKILYRIDSQLYQFNSLDAILNFCDVVKDENLFFGNNTLYKYDDRFFILFSDSAIKNKKFIKTFVILSEYCSRYFSYSMFYTTIKEKGKVIIDKRAIQKLMKFNQE